MSDLFERLTKEATSSRMECKRGTFVNAGVWENHPDLMDDAAERIRILEEQVQALKEVNERVRGLLRRVIANDGRESWVAVLGDIHAEITTEEE